MTNEKRELLKIQRKSSVGTMEPPKNKAEKTRYSDEELQEFWDLIEAKLKIARDDYKHYKSAMSNDDGNGTNDTGPTFKVLEEGADTLSKEDAGRLAQRQFDLIRYLEDAQTRIKNKTYGICRNTGKLIPKERLRGALHATLRIEEKN